MNEATDVLRLNIAPEKPIELLDFLKSCRALANEFDDFAEAHGSKQCKLFIKEVRKGSIEVDLVTQIGCGIMAVQQVMPIIESFNVVSEFIGYIRCVINWLLKGDATSQNSPYGVKTLANVNDFLEPIAKDKGSTVTINNVTVTGDVNAPIIIDNAGANYAQNMCKRVIAEYNTPNVERVEKTLLQWYQSRNSTDQAGDRAIIGSISAKPLKTVFIDSALKSKMMEGNDNPFAGTWLVNVVVERIDGVPKLYKIESMERLKD